MQTKIINTEEAPKKWWAAQDARMRNIANKSHYSYQIQTQVERMKLALSVVYGAKAIYDAFGKTGISIKVDGPWVKNRKELALLEAEWATKGITKKISPQGVTYRLTPQ
jgi:hypothetical protein